MSKDKFEIEGVDEDSIIYYAMLAMAHGVSKRRKKLKEGSSLEEELKKLEGMNLH
ncbi:MAG: hypothetical protein HQ504_10390, partial [Rhodospirillaceae bacterium]|nr:hypothetical protein [Rhodospirillaceae bacterium]